MSVFYAPLSDRFIAITGPDAIKFLQGQSSCDLLSLADDTFTYGTLNTPKGRMYALFKVIKTEDGLLLSIEPGLMENTLQKLKKYAAFFKCTLTQTLEYKAFGLIGLTTDSSAKSLSKQAQAIILTLSKQAHLQEVWLKTENSCEENLHQLFPEIAKTTEEHWHALEARIGIPALYQESQEEFILQTLNLQHIGAVSFKKGCYTGQEIIARMKFLGKLKKKSYQLHSPSKIKPIDANTPIFDKAGKQCGTLVRAHFSEATGSVALAIMDIENALTHEAVYIQSQPEAAFTVSEINYSEFEN